MATTYGRPAARRYTTRSLSFDLDNEAEDGVAQFLKNAPRGKLNQRMKILIMNGWSVELHQKEMRKDSNFGVSAQIILDKQDPTQLQLATLLKEKRITITTVGSAIIEEEDNDFIRELLILGFQAHKQQGKK